MIENIPAYTSWIITGISLGATVIAFAKFWFNRGRNTTEYRIERKSCITKIRSDVEELKKEFETEKGDSELEHETFKQSIHKLRDKVDDIEKDVSYIKGKIDVALRHK